MSGPSASRSGVRTINVTGGSVAGFQMNGREEVAWLRTDTEFNPGNSGGMLVDRQGRLVALPTRVYHGRALEPVEMARPAERIPAEWIVAMAGGPIEGVQIDGVRELTTEGELVDEAVGDSVEIDRSVDQHFWRPSAGLRRPVRVSLDGRHPIAVMRGERVLRQGVGSIELQPGDGPEAVVSILFAHSQDGPVRYRVGLERLEAPVTEAPPQVFTDPPAAATPATSGRAAGATVTGKLLNGTTGQPIVGGWVFVARPGVNPIEILQAWMRGELTQDQLRMLLVTAGRTDLRGDYALEGVPFGRYDGASVAEGFRPSTLRFAVERGAETVALHPVQMTP